MRKLIDSLIVTGAIGFGTIVVLVLVFLAAGVIDMPKLVAIGDILGGRRPAVTPEPTPSATALPLSEVQQAESAKVMAEAIVAQELEFKRREEELQQMNQQLETLAAELDKRRKGLDLREQAVEKTIGDFLAEQTAKAEARKKEGFKDSLEVFEAMRPDDAGRLLAAFKDEEVVEYLRAFEPRFSAKVVNSLAKIGPEGQTYAANLQKLLREGGETSGALPDFSGLEGE